MINEPETDDAVARTAGGVAGDPRAPTTLPRRLFSFVRACSPIAQGFLGAALCALLILVGFWTLQRYHEFVVMRDVVGQVQQVFAQQQQQQAAAKAQAEAASKKPTP